MVFLSPVWPSTFCHHKGTAPLLFFRLSLLDGREEYPAYSETLGGVLESAQTGDWTRKRCLPPPGSRRVPALNGGVQVSWGLHKQGMDGAWDGQRISEAAVVFFSQCTVKVKKEMSRKVKLLIYGSIYIPTLAYGQLVNFGSWLIHDWS